jgi:hypothetical protein
VPEEQTGGGGNQSETSQERLEARLNRFEQDLLKENRWWRGGLIAALVFVALAILVAGHRHHRRPERMAQMGTGWAGSAGMPYGDYGPYPPPPHPGFGWGGPCGPASGYGWGPGQWGGQPRQWGAPGPQAPQGQPPPTR